MQKPDSNTCSVFTSGWAPRVLIGLLLAAAATAVYWPVVGYDFINIDDHLYFSENEHVLAGLTWHNVAWAFQTTYDTSWYPLSWLSFMLDAELFGRGPAGPHLINGLLHVANSVVLFLLLQRLTGKPWRSAFVAGLFALHPLHVESVAWVSERKDVLSTLFGLLALAAYARYAEQLVARSQGSADTGHAWAAAPAHNGPRITEDTSHLSPPASILGLPSSIFYLLALLFFALGLLSKPMLVTLPFVMLLLDYWPLRRIGAAALPGRAPSLPRLLWEKVPFLLLSMAAGIVTVVVHKQAGAITPLGSVSIPGRIENAFVAYAAYLRQTFWPTGLALPYLHPLRWPPGPVALGVALVAGCSVTALWLGRRRPYLPVGWFWFLGTLVPVIGLLQWGNQSMANRFMYVPSIGLFLALAWGLGELLERWRLPTPAVGTVAALALFALAIRSRDQLGYWRNSETLFRHTIAVTTGNYVAYDCLGSALDKEGRNDEALPFLSESVRLQPRYPEGQYNLGTALMRKGRLDEAVRHLTAAVKLKPASAHAHNNLGNALLSQGKLDEAAVHLAQAVRLAPADPEAQYNLGTLLLMQARLERAVTCFSEALRLKPDYGEAYGNLGIAFMRQGKPAEGAASLAAAVKLNPSSPEAHNNLGLALLELNRPRDAAEQFSESLVLNPDAPGPHYHLALALVRLDKPQEALPHARKARALAQAAGQTALAAKADALLEQHR